MNRGNKFILNNFFYYKLALNRYIYFYFNTKKEVKKALLKSYNLFFLININK